MNETNNQLNKEQSTNQANTLPFLSLHQIIIYALINKILTLISL